MTFSAFASRLLLCLSVEFPARVFAQKPQDCSKVPDHNKLKAALTNAVKEGKGHWLRQLPRFTAHPAVALEPLNAPIGELSLIRSKKTIGS
jgi:hypothetical protein